MSSKIELLVQKWADNRSTTLRLRIASLEKWLFNTYEPNKFGDGDFEQRLERWLDNVPDDADKRTLFELVTEIFYVGPIEFEELYRSAYQGIIARWLLNCEGVDPLAPDAQSLLTSAARTTWFCPVSDSFRINAFFHINNLAAGASLRPDWRSLYHLGDRAKIQSYCEKYSIKRLVLLEDFVGGGSQAIRAAEFAATYFPMLEVLFVPLLICPDGAELMRITEARICNVRAGALKYEAVMELPSSAFLTLVETPFAERPQFTSDLRRLLTQTYPSVSGGVRPGPEKPYDPYGYPPAKPTGGMVVMYSNTPDNTLPIIHWRPKNDAWSPLFPRHSRD